MDERSDSFGQDYGHTSDISDVTDHTNNRRKVYPEELPLKVIKRHLEHAQDAERHKVYGYQSPRYKHDPKVADISVKRPTTRTPKQSSAADQTPPTDKWHNVFNLGALSGDFGRRERQFSLNVLNFNVPGTSVVPESDRAKVNYRTRSHSLNEAVNQTASSTPDVEKGDECSNFCSSFPCQCRRFGRKLEKCLLWSIPVVIVLILCTTITVLSISFEYIDYDQIALMRTKSTGKVDKDITYYAGCHVKGPNYEFIRFNSTVHIMKYDRISIFTSSKVEINISLTVAYYIRTEELGQLYSAFASDYEDIIYRATTATIKNTLAPFQLEELRHERQKVEEVLHDAIRTRLDRMFVDAKFVWLGKLEIPDRIEALYMTTLLQKIRAETEQFRQESSVVQKETEKAIKVHTNKANELKENAKSVSSLIKSRAKATEDQISQNATLRGWQSMCQTLGLSNEEHKLSLLFINSMSKMDTLYMAPSYMGGSDGNFSYTYFSGFDRS